MKEPVTITPPHRVHAIMRQTWRDLTFLHWPYDPPLVRRLVPGELELDLYEGAAWVGLVPFGITDLTLPQAPGIPWVSDFPETNVRTYVIDAAGRRGVWFFSLDAARLHAVFGARTAYGLPYFWGAMSVDRGPQSVRYLSNRLCGPSAEADITIETGDAIPHPTELEVFLTARFRLYSRLFGRLVHGDIEHQPWPLQQARVVRMKQTLVRAVGLPPPEGKPLVHFANRVDVLVARPKSV